MSDIDISYSNWWAILLFQYSNIFHIFQYIANIFQFSAGGTGYCSVSDAAEASGETALVPHVDCWHNDFPLAGGFKPSEKYESIGMMTFPIYAEIKVMFQTTNQFLQVRVTVRCQQLPVCIPVMSPGTHDWTMVEVDVICVHVCICEAGEMSHLNITQPVVVESLPTMSNNVAFLTTSFPCSATCPAM